MWESFILHPCRYCLLLFLKMFDCLRFDSCELSVHLLCVAVEFFSYSLLGAFYMWATLVLSLSSTVLDLQTWSSLWVGSLSRLAQASSHECPHGTISGDFTLHLLCHCETSRKPLPPSPAPTLLCLRDASSWLRRRESCGPFLGSGASLFSPQYVPPVGLSSWGAA